jgi:uncharacterized membrane protein
VSGAELSRQLRLGKSNALGRRRQISVLTLISIGSMAIVSLYQLGIIKHLPEPPLPKMDADKVDAAAEAYEILWMPDAVLGLGSYAVTLGLAAMGPDNRARTRPWIPLALAAKTLADSLAAGKLTVDQWTKHKAFCFWCLLAAATSIATLPLSVPEAREAWGQFRNT